METVTKKSICFVVSAPITINAFLLNHIELLSKYYEIHLVVNTEGDSQIQFNNITSIKHIQLVRGISIINDLKGLYKLWGYFKIKQFDAVHTITPKAGLLGMIAANVAGIPRRIHIFTGQVWHTKTGILKWLLKKVDTLLASMATDILVDGKPQRDFLINSGILKKHNSQVLGKGSISGVLCSKFIKDSQIRLSLRASHHIDSTEIVYAFLGRLNTDKGVFDLINAFERLNNKYSNTKLLLIGPDEENIYKKIDLDLTNRILFIGHCNEPHHFLQMADAFCLPSYREGFGNSVLEASVLELPIICSNTYGLHDTILDDVTGLRHNVGDVSALFQQMEKIYLSETLRKELGTNGRSYVLSNFNADAISNYWLAFYKNLFAASQFSN